jgi:predicted membrane protein
MNHPHRQFWGIALIVLGAIIVVANRHLSGFSSFFSTAWPVLLVGVGAVIIATGRQSWFGALRRWTEHVAGGVRDMQDGTHLEHHSLVGNVDLTVTDPVRGGGTVSSVIGDVKLDLTRGAGPDASGTLVASTVVGDILVLLPERNEATIAASSLLGTVHVDGQKQSGFACSLVTRGPEVSHGSRPLQVKASTLIGEVRVLHAGTPSGG